MVLILDIAMPKINGYTLLHQIRKLVTIGGKQIPAIGLTAFITDDERAAALEAGFQIYLTKPFNLVELITAIENLAIDIN